VAKNEQNVHKKSQNKFFVCQKSKFWSIIKILVKNKNLGQKSKFWSKIKILVKINTLVKK